MYALQFQATYAPPELFRLYIIFLKIIKDIVDKSLIKDYHKTHKEKDTTNKSLKHQEIKVES